MDLSETLPFKRSLSCGQPPLHTFPDSHSEHFCGKPGTVYLVMKRIDHYGIKRIRIAQDSFFAAMVHDTGTDRSARKGLGTVEVIVLKGFERFE
jgi:hypothetical protein